MDTTPSPATAPPPSPSAALSQPRDIGTINDLCTRGQWRVLLDHLSHPKPQSLPPHHRLLYSTLTAVALFKLRRFSDALALTLSLLPPDTNTGDAGTLNAVDPFSHPRFLYSSYPDLYPPSLSLSGSFVPFSLRLLLALLPGKLNDRPVMIDRLYLLLEFARANSWHRREAFVMSVLVSDHFAHKEFDVVLSLLEQLLEKDPSNESLLSKVGYILLQIGDVRGAKEVFDRVELITGNAGESIVRRNRAVGHIVAKDFVSAIREYESCIEENPADVVALNNKAICLMYSRDLSDAIKGLEGALERVPTVAVDETVVVNLCSMYELAYVNHGDVKKTLNGWIARVAPDDFDSSCTRI